MSKKNKKQLLHCGFLSVNDSDHELEMWSNATSPTLKTIAEYDDFEERDSTCDVAADEDSLDSITNCFGGCKSLKPSAFEQVLPEIALDEESSDSSSSDYDTITRCFGGEKNFSSLSYSEMFTDTEDELVETYDDTFSREMLIQLMQPSKPSVCRSTERTVVASLELDNNTQGNSNPRDSKQKQPRFHSYAEAEDFAARYLIENFSAGLCYGTPYIRVGDVFRLISSTSVVL